MVEGIINLTQQAPRLIFMRAFTQYFEGKPSGLNPGSVIRSSPYFTSLRSAISASIQEDFTAAREYVKVGMDTCPRCLCLYSIVGRLHASDAAACVATAAFNPCGSSVRLCLQLQRLPTLIVLPTLAVPQLFEAYRMVYDFGRTWSYEEYSSKPKSLREIRRDMHKQREWRNELDRMKIFNVRAYRHSWPQGVASLFRAKATRARKPSGHPLPAFDHRRYSSCSSKHPTARRGIGFAPCQCYITYPYMYPCRWWAACTWTARACATT